MSGMTLYTSRLDIGGEQERGGGGGGKFRGGERRGGEGRGELIPPKWVMPARYRKTIPQFGGAVSPGVLPN